MFTIYSHTVGGRRFDRYFKNWTAAQNALLRDATDLKRAGWKVDTFADYFDSEKGFYVYEIHGTTIGGEAFSLALLDGYFED